MPEVAQLVSNMAFDTIDKTITVIIALIIKHLFPDRAADLIDFELWQQAPLTDEERESLRKSSHPRIVSAHTKIACIMSVVLISAVAVNTWISFVTFRDSMVNEHVVYGQGCEILENAVAAVSEPTYLDEAKNLAHYHHEK